MDDLVDIRLTVNGQTRSGRCEPRKLLVDFIREDLGLTGTHAGCEHGICGACTILINGEAGRSCITLAVQADVLLMGQMRAMLEECYWMQLNQLPRQQWAEYFDGPTGTWVGQQARTYQTWTIVGFLLLHHLLRVDQQAEPSFPTGQ